MYEWFYVIHMGDDSVVFDAGTCEECLTFVEEYSKDFPDEADFLTIESSYEYT